MGPTGITESDLQQMLAIARDYTDDGDEALPWELLHDLKRLVGCDVLSACGMDSGRGEVFADQEVPGPDGGGVDAKGLEPAFWANYWGSGCSYEDRTGDITAVLRTSDLESDLEYRSSPMYSEYLKPLGVEREIRVCLDAGRPGRTLRLLFARGAGADFSQRDVAVLTLLRPHLQSAYLTAERRRRNLLPLTNRQRQILDHVAAGFTNGQIARRLDVSESTVRKHLENIFARLEVTSRTAAVARVTLPL